MHKEDCLLFDSGEMGKDEAVQFERHLASCSECRDWLGAIGSARRWAGVLSEEPPSRLTMTALETTRAVSCRRTASRLRGMAFVALLGAFFIWQRPRSSIKMPPTMAAQWDTSDLHASILRAQDGIGDIESTLGSADGGIDGRLKAAQRHLNRIREKQRTIRLLLEESES
jgi:hypothetical protein